MNMPAQPSGNEYLRAVLTSKVYDVVEVTPLQKMEKLSERFNNQIYIKREDRQPVISFKIRGAYAMIAGLNEQQSRRCDCRFAATMRKVALSAKIRLKRLDCDAAKYAID